VGPAVGQDGGAATTWMTVATDLQRMRVSSEPTGTSSFVDDVIQGTNAARASQGLGRLRKSAKRQAAAMDYAQTMAQEHHFGHKGTDGSKFADRAELFGYSHAGMTENIIGKGYESGKEAVH
jgi:uncharacterized protein YkwD